MRWFSPSELTARESILDGSRKGNACWIFMSTVRSSLIGVAVIGGLIAVLFASGVVELSGSSDEGAASRRGSHPSSKKKRHLDSLGYIGAVEIEEKDRDKVGTTIHDESRAHQGLSLYNPCAWGRKYRRAAGGKVLREARIINNAGRVLHTWGTRFVPDRKRGWARAKLDGEGNLYAVNARSGFVKLDWDSNTLWSVKKAFHHDFSFGPDGKIYALVEHGRHVTFKGTSFDLLDNGIVILGPNGAVEDEIWFSDVLEDMPEVKRHFAQRLKRKPPKGGLAHDEDEDGFDEKEGRVLFGRDLFHANTLNFMTKTIEGVANKGDIITSIREMDMVVILDKKTFEPKWQWGPGELQRQHDPEQVDSGHLLVFDNGRGRKASRVLELDPTTKRVVWEYKNDDFFSDIRGLSQRLPNGNTLVVSSQRGRAFEVTPKGRTVWEYWSPDVLGGNKLRVPLRMERLQGEALAFARQQIDAGKGNPHGARAIGRGIEVQAEGW